MHILVLPSFYPSQARPFTGIFFQEQATALKRAGHQVGVLVAPRIRETLDYVKTQRALPDLKTATVEGSGEMPIYRMHWGWFPRVFPRIAASLHEFAGIRAYQRYCDEYGKPDLIHAHNTFYSGYMAARIGAKFGTPVVLTEHSSNFLRGRIFLPGQHRVVRDTLQQVDTIMAVSLPLVNKLKAYVPEREIVCINNVVNTDFFSLGAAVERSPFIFAFAANALLPLKRVDLLLKAFAKAHKGETNVTLWLAGGGSERRQYEVMAHELGITEQVNFLGKLARDGIRDLFQKAHVIVSSSDVETFGITLIEAMACGKPVIATRSGGPEGFVNETNGMLVPIGDVDALADAMSYMVAHYNQYDLLKIRQECVDKFSEGAIVRRLETIYEQTLHNYNLNYRV